MCSEKKNGDRDMRFWKEPDIPALKTKSFGGKIDSL